jgi:hypothetical protein
MHPKLPMLGDSVLVVSPEHYDTFMGKHSRDSDSAGLGAITKDGLRDLIMLKSRTAARDLVSTKDCGGANPAMFRAISKARQNAAGGAAVTPAAVGTGSASADSGGTNTDDDEMVLTEEELDATYPKFRSKERLHIVVAGGNAGKFSVYMGGWASGIAGSQPVSKKIEDVMAASSL